MPELPEVHTVAAGLRRMFDDRRIVSLTCHRRSLREPLPVDLLEQVCVGFKINRLLRRGKYIIWEMSSGGAVILHLGMSGRFRKVTTGTPYIKHEHITFVLDNGEEIRYGDPRRFGFFDAVVDGDWQWHKKLVDLGPEPLDRLDADYLLDRAAGRTVPIKLFILDQKMIAGIGNIYANEALFQAGIHPRTPSGQLSVKQWRDLAMAIQKTLERAISAGGTTLSKGGFIDAEGRHGQFKVDLTVYGRNGEPCRNCGEVIQCHKMAGRATYFCPTCQVLPERK